MTAEAWPFLVARGVSAGHRLLLAPGFLLRANDTAILDSLPPADVHEPAHMGTLISRSGHHLYCAYQTREITDQDVGPAGSTRDEHGRPLVWNYGLLTHNVLSAGVNPADMEACRAAAAAAYRQFQADERMYRVETASSFTLTSQSREPETRRPEGQKVAAAMRIPEADPRRKATNRAPVVVIVLAALMLLLFWALLPSPAAQLPSQRPSPSPSSTTSVRDEDFRNAPRTLTQTASWWIKPDRAQPSAVMTAWARAVLIEWSPVRSSANPETSIRWLPACATMPPALA
jgi:hypothetical protein